MSFINSFQDTIAGTTAVATMQFILPVDTDLTNAYVSFELLDTDGVVYTSGTASSLDIVNRANSRVLECLLEVSVPSNIPVNDINTTYQVRVELSYGGTTTELYSNLKVLPAYATQQGVEDIIELLGKTINQTIVLPALVDTEDVNNTPLINCLIYQGNDLLDVPPIQVLSPVQTVDGYAYKMQFNTGLYKEKIPPSLTPLNIVWEYVIDGEAYTENGDLFLVTPSILQAIKDMLSEINKARTSVRDKPTFSVTDALTHLRLGGDAFNGFSHTTMFTYTNATGPVRTYWLAFSKISALRSQYMFEAESNFEFSGQAISLNVQREQYYDAMANAIENTINEPAKNFKAILSKRGNIEGDGNVNPNSLKNGAFAALGVSLSPVSRIRPWNPNSWIGGQRSIF